MRGRRTRLANFPNKHRHKCWPLICVIFVCECVCVYEEEASWTVHTQRQLQHVLHCTHVFLGTHSHTYRLHSGEPTREDGNCTAIINCHSSTSKWWVMPCHWKHYCAPERRIPLKHCLLYEPEQLLLQLSSKCACIGRKIHSLIWLC